MSNCLRFARPAEARPEARGQRLEAVEYCEKLVVSSCMCKLGALGELDRLGELGELGAMTQIIDL